MAGGPPGLADDAEQRARYEPGGERYDFRDAANLFTDNDPIPGLTPQMRNIFRQRHVTLNRQDETAGAWAATFSNQELYYAMMDIEHRLNRDPEVIANPQLRERRGDRMYAEWIQERQFARVEPLLETKAIEASLLLMQAGTPTIELRKFFHKIEALLFAQMYAALSVEHHYYGQATPWAEERRRQNRNNP